MVKEIELRTPLRAEDVRGLKVGDVVYLSGVAHQMRRVAHARACEYLDEGRELPFDLTNGVVYHAWSAIQESGERWMVRYVGGTLSMRMSRYLPALLKTYDIHAIVGKAGAPVSEDAKQAMREVGCVHLGQISGCAAYRPCFADEARVYWEDLGDERVAALTLNRLGPLVVCIDAAGNEIYKAGSYVIPNFYR